MLKNLHPKRLFSFVHFYLLLIFLISIKGWACEIKIFDCAQGNAVVAKYNNQTMVFDAGRKAHTKFVQYIYETEDDSTINDQFLIDKKHEWINLEAIPSVKLPTIADYDKNYYKEEFEDKFKKYVNKDSTLKAVFVSHPDVDHYNLIQKFKLKPKVFILGGFYPAYLDSDTTPFRNYIETLEKDNKTKIIKMTNYTKKEINNNKNIKNNYSQSSVKAYTDLWNENGGGFSPNGNNGSGPEVKILSANAGKLERKSKNEDSIIVKITFANESIIIPGDAEKGNWQDISEDDIKADYLLLSHHGSKTKGSTTLELLNRIKPKSCFISAGFNYNHPNGEIVNYLLKYFKEEKYNTTPHFITFFDKKTLKTRFISAPIFSTIDNGILTINLGQDIVKVARNFMPSPDIFLSGEDGNGKKYEGEYEPDPSSTHTHEELKILNGNREPTLKYSASDNLYEIFNNSTKENEVYFKHGKIYIKYDLNSTPAEDGESGDDDSHESSNNNYDDVEDDDSQESSENNNSAEGEDISD